MLHLLQLPNIKAMTAQTKHTINLSQKRTISHCLTKYWLKYDDLYPGDLMRHEIEQKNKMMDEISELRSKISYAPPVKYERRYEFELNPREKKILKAALYRRYMILNHESDKLSIPKDKIKRMEKEMEEIGIIYRLFKF
jgi:hypothetical protein